MAKRKFPSVERMKKEGTYREVKVKCAYCDLKDTCHLRSQKETYEEAGFLTRCPFARKSKIGKTNKKNKAKK